MRFCKNMAVFHVFWGITLSVLAEIAISLMRSAQLFITLLTRFIGHVYHDLLILLKLHDLILWVTWFTEWLDSLSDLIHWVTWFTEWLDSLSDLIHWVTWFTEWLDSLTNDWNKNWPVVTHTDTYWQVLTSDNLSLPKGQIHKMAATKKLAKLKSARATSA